MTPHYTDLTGRPLGHKPAGQSKRAVSAASLWDAAAVTGQGHTDPPRARSLLGERRRWHVRALALTPAEWLVASGFTPTQASVLAAAGYRVVGWWPVEEVS